MKGGREEPTLLGLLEILTSITEGEAPTMFSLFERANLSHWEEDTYSVGSLVQ
jgi:hypothetical protein